MARCMLVHAGLSEKFWAEAIATAAYLRNRLPSKSIGDITPNEIWHKRKPGVHHLKTFGCLAIALDKVQKRKFQPKGRECIMVGYSYESKAYRLFDIKARKIIVCRDVKFNENILMGSHNGDVNDLLRNIKEDEQMTEEAEISSNDNNNNNSAANICKVGRGRPKTIRSGKPGRPMEEYNVVNLLDANKVEIPETVSSVYNNEYSKEWLKAMDAEYKSLLDNDTFTLVDLPQGQKAIGCRWVYAIKTDKDNKVQRFKARLVAKGCSQKYGLNYTETFAPVIRHATIRMLFALAVKFKLHLHQLDVTTAYLNSELEEECYMQQPEGYVSSEYPDRVLRLNKAIYGLKQSGKAWNTKMDGVLKRLGFKPCQNEPCLYISNTSEKVIFIAIYVDDLLIGSACVEELEDIKLKLAKEVKLVDKGQISYFLGWEIERDGDTGPITVCQSKYINQLLEKHNMKNCRPVSTPLDPGFKIELSDTAKSVDKVKYQSLIGELMYLAVSTRPDILHSVSKLAQYNINPTLDHENGAKHVLRYLSKTLNYKLHYEVNGHQIFGYTDADWGGDTRDRKSYTGYIFLLCGGAVSWESKKQSIVALSTTEAEYVALSSSAKEGIFLKRLLEEMGYHSQNCPIEIKGDNLSAQCLTKNQMYHARTKHIDIRYHHIRNCVKDNIIKLNYICSSSNVADLLTKNLSKEKHYQHLKTMGIY